MKNILKTILASALVIGILAGGWVLYNRFLDSSNYEGAILLADVGDVSNAYKIFLDLGDYRDSEERLNALLEQDPALPFRDSEKGSMGVFGHWEQDNNPENGAEPIEWIVLSRQDDRVLLLSEMVLDGGAYNDEPFGEITWEDSRLRSWLNDEFLNAAFNEAERSLILTVENRNEDQSVRGTPGGNDTEDRVFLLSEVETQVYLNDAFVRDSIGKALATDYAKSRQVETDESGYASWWLRSPGVYPYSAQFVDQEGEIYVSGAYVDIDYQFGVRPAIWLRLN